VPTFLDTMRKAVFGYKDFLEDVKKREGLEELNNEARLKKIYKLSI